MLFNSIPYIHLLMIYHFQWNINLTKYMIFINYCFMMLSQVHKKGRTYILKLNLFLVAWTNPSLWSIIFRNNLQQSSSGIIFSDLQDCLQEWYTGIILRNYLQWLPSGITFRNDLQELSSGIIFRNYLQGFSSGIIFWDYLLGLQLFSLNNFRNWSRPLLTRTFDLSFFLWSFLFTHFGGTQEADFYGPSYLNINRRNM